MAAVTTACTPVLRCMQAVTVSITVWASHRMSMPDCMCAGACDAGSPEDATHKELRKSLLLNRAAAHIKDAEQKLGSDSAIATSESAS